MCGCSGNRSNLTAGRQSGARYVYDVTLDGEIEPTPYGTPIEAKMAVRRAGGGTIVRVPVDANGARIPPKVAVDNAS